MKRLWGLFCSLSRSWQIALVVLAIHVAILIALIVHHAGTRREHLKRMISVRTVLLARKEIAQAPTEKMRKSLAIPQTNPAKEKKETSRQKQPSPVLKKEKISSASKEKPTQKKSASSSTVENDPINEGLLNEIVQGLETVSTPSEKSRAGFSISLPKSVQMKAQIEAIPSIEAPSYGEAVVTILQNCLNLPEMGEVVVQIEIDTKGAVIDCEVLNEKSRKNGEFLKNRLHELTFPCFNEFSLDETRLNFTITFRNVENR